ncbi:uncharacterized protein CMU_026460 [Cryptosporidium muris RN66]|uniref:SAP domain-containing protein n=1 Tax=Cryptosporidium muris (strain RN66) TaxID=441375 RepID=B6AB86_CRYMR|nr:uncharacterized protein CMU_026460 [Cryptosporidium muris RN66]EEA05638.1 hypothetical protein, conserved [Cryptosporidium muris RN66]|eukprot:XP_002139987.1 hypothetical protein [Cryptosporidium muris RN66]
MNNYHQERSRIIQRNREEIRALEKEIKNKKGILKQQCQKNLETVLKRQEEELQKFEAQYNYKTTKTKSSSRGTICDTNIKPITLHEEKQWSSLSKTELESECRLRGLNSKGSREDLVTRLYIFTIDQKSKVNKNSDTNNMEITSNNNIKNDNISTQYTTFAVPPNINFSDADGTGKRKGKSTKRKVDHRKQGQHRQDSWAAFCARNSIPRKTNKELDSESEDQDNESSEENNSESNSDHIIIDEEERARQRKREVVMAKALEKILTNISSCTDDGITIDDLIDQLTKLNIRNFRPELLGYKTSEDWIAAQPKKLLVYDIKNKRIYPPGFNLESDDFI